jgi:hypothetical protein
VASRGALSGLALAEIAAGVVLAWSGIENQALTITLQSLISGRKPPPGPAAGAAETPAQAIQQATGVSQAPPSSASVAGYQAYAQALLIAHGWPGQFAAFSSIVDAESSWNPSALNPSGAYGIAQALGHGTAQTAGSVTNQYGNYGTSDATCQAANSGSGTAQIEWMCNYIAAVYGSPDAAWAYHQANGSY